ncbi:unnamed protein product [Microthlaspi erraticum]|uniref:F-box domain-containing protein n=1 Tax=Microthlaspi erraticum TaxID=1685480 RepID=A0A6D2HHP8_9BRAS|nr:unnamed protein product [Microthlaspi erraticum]
MILSDFPSELVEEILSRVPAASLKRLRSTCKQWNSLFKEPGFTEKHFRTAPKQSHVLLLKDHRVYSTNISFNVAPPSIEFKGPLCPTDSHSNSEQIDIFQVIHCDGLLLCISTMSKIVVWNPWLGEARRIQSKGGYKAYSQFGIGYDNNKPCRSYKILRFWPKWNYDNRVYEFEIYELRSGSWRVLDDVSLDYDTHVRQEGIVSLKGNTYWLGKDKDLLCFDFTTERLKHRPLLPLFPKSDHAALSAVKDEKLAVLHLDFGTLQVTMWVTDRIDETEGAILSWSKFFKVDFDCTLRYPFPFFRSFLYDEEKKTALCGDLDSGANKKKLYIIRKADEYNSETPYVEFTNQTFCRPCLFYYVPSLVQIPAK